MKNYIFAIMIAIAVAASAPANAQTDPQCGFPACSINVELNPALVVQHFGTKYQEFLICYDNAVDHWETQKDIAWDEFVSNQVLVLGTAATVGGGCYLGKLKIKSIRGLLDAIASKVVPKYCLAKAAAAGVAAEAGFFWYYRQHIKRLCKEHDSAVRACARIIDRNFKVCDL